MMEAIRDGRSADLQSLVVARAQADASKFSGNTIAGWARNGGLYQVEITGEQVIADFATVNAKLHFMNGTTSDVSFRLNAEGGEWKVQPE